MSELTQKLFKLQDLKYRDFQSKLIPTIEKERIIGIRTPVLRKFAKEFATTFQKEEFLSSLPHYCFEENNLHAFIIEKETDYKNAIKLINDFLPYINNWATCDGMSPTILKKNTNKLLSEINNWLESNDTYTIRFAILCLMRYYLDENFDEEHLNKIVNINSTEYYVNMMRAWYFATALAKQYDSTILIFEKKLLDSWTHNKAIQKAIESNRVKKETKEYIRKLKI